MSDAQVFGASLSPYVKKVEYALRHKGVSYRVVPPSSPADFKKWSPTTRKMPVLEWRGERTYDSTFILRRLDREIPQPPLFADDPTVAARQRQLEDWSDESLYWLLMALRWCSQHSQASIDQILASVPIPGLFKPILGRRIRKQAIAATIAQGNGRLPHDVLVNEIGLHLDDLVTLLGDSPFFFSDRVGGADLAVRGMFSAGRSGPTPEIQALIEARPGLVAWMARVDAATEGKQEAA